MSGALSLRRLEGELAVCRLGPDAELPAGVLGGELSGVVKTAEETSVVCGFDLAPEGVPVEGPFVAFVVDGPLDFSLVGILASLSTTLAEAGISIFALSTYDTDYILVGTKHGDAAATALRAAGHDVR